MRVATGQFPVSGDISRNLAYIQRQIASAAGRRADVILFPETALGGYPGVDFDSFAGYDWDMPRRAAEKVMESARRHGIWVILGSNHRLSAGNKPHNSLYAISPEGRVVDRYDKRFCAASELAYYRPGTRAVTLRIGEVLCGLLICHEWRYPELYRQYKRLGVSVIFQAFYDGGLSENDMRKEGKLLAEVIPATMRGHAVCSHLWICGTNTSRKQSCYGGFVIRPDGAFLQRQPRHRAGVMVTTIDTDAKIEDPAAHARAKAIRGVDNLGRALKDPRSTNRHSL
ncbi:MAG: carbon-nitrogen hydrolase family protein [bacterium]|nr:carbon-nitrogen hydrolase family protein [bacterium]